MKSVKKPKYRTFEKLDKSFDINKRELSKFSHKLWLGKKYEVTKDVEFTEKEETPSNFKPLTAEHSLSTRGCIKKISAWRSRDAAAWPGQGRWAYDQQEDQIASHITLRLSWD